MARRSGAPAVLLALLLAAGCLAGPAATTGPAGGADGVFSDTDVFPGDYDATGLFSRTLREGPFALRAPTVETLASELDGARMQVGLVLPDAPDGVRVPVLAIASPYYAPLTPESMAADEFTATTTYAQAMYLLFAKRYVPHGYAVALVPLRGTADNGGCMDFNGPAERADVSQAVTWLATRPWSNGNVGMVGGSYDATSQWDVAATGNPHLKAMVAIAGVTDLYSMLYRNGSTDTRGLGGAFANYWSYGLAQPGRAPENVLDAAACPEVVQAFRSHADAGLGGARDAWWAERDLRPGSEATPPAAVFLVQGLQDRVVNPTQAYPWIRELEARGVPVKHLLGQWGHAWPDRPDNGVAPRWDWAEMLLRWLDRWLKEDAGVDVGPRVQAQDSEGRWRSEDAWPPSDARPVALHLDPSGALAREPAESGRVALCPDLLDGVVEPPTLAGAPSCVAGARFASEPLDAPFRFAGLPTLHLPVVPHGPGGHLTARLYLAADGATTLLGRAQMDLRYAAGGETPAPVQAGAPLVARMELEPLDAVVPQGARLLLVIEQGSLEERMPSVPTFPLDLALGGEEGGVLTVLSFERAEADLFEPPR